MRLRLPPPPGATGASGSRPREAARDLLASAPRPALPTGLVLHRHDNSPNRKAPAAAAKGDTGASAAGQALLLRGSGFGVRGSGFGTGPARGGGGSDGLGAAREGGTRLPPGLATPRPPRGPPAGRAGRRPAPPAGPGSDSGGSGGEAACAPGVSPRGRGAGTPSGGGRAEPRRPQQVRGAGHYLQRLRVGARVPGPGPAAGPSGGPSSPGASGQRRGRAGPGARIGPGASGTRGPPGRRDPRSARAASPAGDPPPPGSELRRRAVLAPRGVWTLPLAVLPAPPPVARATGRRRPRSRGVRRGGAGLGPRIREQLGMEPPGKGPAAGGGEAGGAPRRPLTFST